MLNETSSAQLNNFIEPKRGGRRYDHLDPTGFLWLSCLLFSAGASVAAVMNWLLTFTTPNLVNLQELLRTISEQFNNRDNKKLSLLSIAFFDSLFLRFTFLHLL